MSLFQSPPRDRQEYEAARPLDISPDQVREMTEAEWYDKVYRGDVPQLTFRAVGMGALLGFILAFTNLYVGLKTGWGLGVAITACILAYALSNAMVAVGLARTPLTILETNCMQSTASAAGYSTGSTMVSAIPALLMLSVTDVNPGGVHLPPMALALTIFSLGVLGTVMAIPMKRNLINHERLTFPSGTAAAVTLQSLYSEGEQALRKARALLYSGLIASAFPVMLDMNLKAGEGGREPLLPGYSPLFDFLPAFGAKEVDGETVQFKPSDWNVQFGHNPVMIAAGMIMGVRVTFWMLMGGALLVWVVGPYGWESQWDNPATHAMMRATSAPHKAWKEIGIWLGVPIMVSSSLLMFAMQWRTILRAFQGLGSSGDGGPEDPRITATEVPFSWFVYGMCASGAVVVAVCSWAYSIPWYYGSLAVVLTFFLSLVAARATGETDVTPTGAMGKIMQLTYGVLIPQDTTVNLMTANITSNASVSCADLLNDLKSGYLLGADPRRQFVAQAAGILSGTIAMVGGFYLLVPDASVLLGTDDKPAQFPAPAAQSWKAVAEVFKYGLDGMHPVHQQAIVVGLTVGVILVLAETLFPKARPYLPSATGLGLGLILPFWNPLSMFIGAAIAWAWNRSSHESHEMYMIPIASGVIAGISLMGVLAAFLNTTLLAS
ncbi:MAG TPA: OPT family oligopeptide transporter [Myxococcota bacterium]|nr:OPT family oligopeptide transporter [Myxococcota bacterium]